MTNNDTTLDDLEHALVDMLELVHREQFARRHWVNEDKDEWQRNRVSRTRQLLSVISRYL
jgi:hypothetical protein